MIETTFNKVYPLKEINVQLTKSFEKKKRFRRSTVVYNFIDYIVKNVYLINDDIYDIDDNKKTE
jgi:hypothetical protein